MTKILDKKLSNIESNILDGLRVFKGRLQLLVDEYPEFIYRQIDWYYYAETDGLVSIYEHRPTENDDFGGRQITLDMEDGTEKIFKGILWHPFFLKSTEIPSYAPCAVTTEPEVWERGHTFYAYSMTKALYDQLVTELGHAEILGSAGRAF